LFEKFKLVWRQETSGFHVRLLLARFLLKFLPIFVGSRLRSIVLKLAGFNIGYGTLLTGTPTIIGDGNIYRRLHIGQNCFINIGCFLDVSAEIVIGNNVSFGQEVMLLTNSHKLSEASRRAGELFSLPIHIGDGAWLGARCTIFPGVTVGRGAVVAAGAVVTKDVSANTMVGGVPASEIRNID
jgi:maltose O-acetyltransferase